MKRKGYRLDRVVAVILRYLLRIDGQEDKEYEQIINEPELLEHPETFGASLSALLTPDEPMVRRRERAYRQFHRYTRQRNRLIPIFWKRIAAIALLLMTIGGGIWWLAGTSEKVSVYPYAIAPTQSKAFLVLSDGSRVDLSTSADYNRIEKDYVTVCDSGILEYDRSTASTQQELAFNQIYVPRGGEYHLILSDGTRVWVNADSELKYPVRFGKHQREVFIRGEAYFDVTKDSDSPFIVHTSRGTVNVLGTEFNIRDYTDESAVVTTLVKGAVEYRTANSAICLEPGFQAVDENGKVVVRKVNPEEHVGWKDGKYIFFDENLESLMHYVERTYDVAVFFAQEEVKQLRFSGDLQRYDRVELFLRYLEKGGDVRFDVNQRTITVYKK